MENKLKQAYKIAQTYDVSTKPDAAVVYSVSFMPTDKNKKQAQEFIITNPDAKMLDDTPCGKALIALGLEGTVDEVSLEITKIWQIASKRFIDAASGNINAFIDGADERSTFCTTELQEILNNPHITHINGIEKEKFASTITFKHYN